MLDVRIIQNSELVKVGVVNAFKYLSENYGFRFMSDISLYELSIGFKPDQYVVLRKKNIYVYASWNIYEGINFQICGKNENIHPIKNLSMLRADLVVQEAGESYSDYIQRRKNWIMNYRDLELLDSYKKDPSKYVEYYLLTEIKIIEKYFPDVFERGEYPN